jgi:phage terminase large subunit
MRDLIVNWKIWEAVNKPQPIIVIVGGRGSGKSIAVGDILTFEMEAKGYDVYCLREFQESISDSVHRVFESSIKDRLKLDGWEIQKNTVIAPNGAKTTYKGANRNPDAMQSAQGYLRSWFEEAHRASETSLDKLLPTILRNPGAKCIFTANPQSSGDAFSKRFIVPYQQQIEKNGYYEDELHYIVFVNWKDNPWWNGEQEALRKWDYDNLPRAKYDWIWEGKFLDTVDNAIISAEWFDACIDAHKKLGFTAQGQERVAYDPADTGDAKAVAYIHGVVVKDVRSKTDGHVDTATDWACDFAQAIKPDCFTWDADGMGAGLKRQIMDAFKGKKMTLAAFHGSAMADMPDARYEPLDGDSRAAKTNRDTFFNLRAQCYWLLRDRMFKTWQAVERGKYHNPDDLISFSSEIKELQGLRSELCRIPRKFNGAGRIQLVAKPDMKKEGIDSPNMADAVMMLMKIPREDTVYESMEFASEW